MLNRRHLRIKVLQALYAYFKSNNDEIKKGEKELFHSLDRIYDLYLYMLLLVIDVRVAAQDRIDENKKKRLPSEEDLNPNLRFVDNAILVQLDNNEQLTRLAETRKLHWADEKEMIKKMFREIRHSDEYEAYMNGPQPDYADQKAFIVKIFRKYIANFELVHHFFEERSIYWGDDLDLVCAMAMKTMKLFEEDNEQGGAMLELYKDPEDEIGFIKDLFRKTLLESEESEVLIQEKAKNWESERIASMDMLLMKMAIAEVKQFKTIPVKVTLNEYIEISKFYSTPKSSVFINGILDKVFEDLKEEGKIKKVGRGLIT